MNQPFRTSSALSLAILSSMIAGCAAPQASVGSATHFGGKADGDIGLATRALAALNSNNVPLAIELGERAVAKTPNDAGFRALLGNAYFAAGRFRSAEDAYRDALTLYSNQPQAVLKLALVQIAQGKNDQAVQLLTESGSVLDRSDYGLALALAGRSGEAVTVLEAAARDTAADPRVRQNLALAHALAGDWAQARIVAAQDVPANQLDARIQQWMQLAAPHQASDQVAALVGVTPAASDAGQPVQLALNKSETRQAQAAPAPQPAPAAPPVQTASFEAAPPAPVVAVAPAPPPERPTLATLATTAVDEAKAVLASLVPHAAQPAPKAVKAHRIVQPAAVRRGNAPTVVQLGAYQSSARVLTAWTNAARKYGALKPYLPMSARFVSPKGTFYRLSVRGFASVGEANGLCNSLRRQGGSCFVRGFAGDKPVEFASR